MNAPVTLASGGPVPLAALAEIGWSMVGSPRPEAALAAILELAQRHLPGDGLGIWTVRDAVAAPVATTGALLAGRDGHVDAAIARALALGQPATSDGDAAGVILAHPLVIDGQVAGVLILLRRDGQPLAGTDQENLRAVVRLAEAAIGHARLYRQTRAHAEALAHLQEISLALNAELDPRRVLERIVEAATGLTGAYFASVMVLDADGAPRDYLTNDPLDGVQPIPMPTTLRPGGTTVTILESRQPLVIADVATDQRANPLLRARSIGATIGLPLLVGDRPIGLLWVNYAQPHAPASDEVGLLTTLAAQAATALRNAHLYDEARRLADRDPLTSLANYRTLQERLRQQLAAARRQERPLSIVMLDLDDFKRINDTLGHLAGDAVLRRVATLLVDACRDSDTVGRYGGDEFLLLLPHTDAVGAAALADRIRARIVAEPVVIDTHVARSSVSLGVATFPNDAADVESLMAIADARLYARKSATTRQRSAVRPAKRAVRRRLAKPAPPR